MIAPLRDPDGSSSTVQNAPLKAARQIVAAALLSNRVPDATPRVAAWKGWAFVAWLVFTAAAYARAMLGIG